MGKLQLHHHQPLFQLGSKLHVLAALPLDTGLNLTDRQSAYKNGICRLFFQIRHHASIGPGFAQFGQDNRVKQDHEKSMSRGCRSRRGKSAVGCRSALPLSGATMLTGSLGMASRCSIKLTGLIARLSALRCKASKSCSDSTTTACLPRRVTCCGTPRTLSTRALNCAFASCRRQADATFGD